MTAELPPEITMAGYAADYERIIAATREELPPCPSCGCRTSSDADGRECGRDAGCNDGPYAPGINVLLAAERERIAEMLRTVQPAEFLIRHGLHSRAGASRILFAVAAEIEGTRD